jgi:UDP-N-acetylmuramyl pentapeptide phosphotransferase/UDP-N-acetylglucosamine-1-phosphate transferase
MSKADAVYAFLTAFAVAAALTPLTARLARRVGAVDRPSDRGLGGGSTPLLGGLAMLGAVLVASALFLDFGGATEDRLRGILGGAILIAVVGALDDRFDLPPGVKLAGQIAAASIPVATGVEVTNITLPFIGAVDFGNAGGVLTVAGLVAVMNVVNLSDGVDGLAAGVCAISAIAFSIIAFDLDRNHAGVLAAVTAGAALGFLVWNFHPAAVYMGDCGSNLLGLLLGCVAVEGAVKTQAVLALLFPLVVLAVPFLDTTFVVSAAPSSTSTPGRSSSAASPWRCASCRTPTTTATCMPAGRGSWRSSASSSSPRRSTSSMSSRSSSSSASTRCACGGSGPARPRSTPTSRSASRPGSSSRCAARPRSSKRSASDAQAP